MFSTFLVAAAISLGICIVFYAIPQIALRAYLDIPGVLFLILVLVRKLAGIAFWTSGIVAGILYLEKDTQALMPTFLIAAGISLGIFIAFIVLPNFLIMLTRNPIMAYRIAFISKFAPWFFKISLVCALVAFFLSRMG